MLPKNKIFVLMLLCACSFGYAQETKRDTLPKYSYSSITQMWSQLDDIFNDPNFSNANWGVVIQSLETGEYFYKRNENKLFMPASNMKLFTTATGLTALGSNYKYETEVYYRGTVTGSTLNGDIIIRGSGDPTISGRFYKGDLFKVYNDWADSLIEKGIDEINGNIIGDDNYFDDIGMGPGWSWDYESYWYAASTSAVSFNDNCVDINVTVDKNEDVPVIKITPNTKYVIVLNNVTVVPDDSITNIDINRERGTNVISVYGTIRLSDSVRTFSTINNPTQYAMVVLKDVLEKKGIIVSGYPMDIDDISLTLDYSKCNKVFSYYSPELKDIIKVINKSSHNFYADQLLKTVGLEFKKRGSFENGVEAIEPILEEMGINSENIIIRDGSGLSRSNLVTPTQIVSLLSYMYNSKNFLPFYNSLPIAGVDGTLGKRMKNTMAENKVRAKTGFINNVRSLSGYTFTGDNEPIVFSIIANNFIVPVKLAENIQDLVCLRLSNFKRNDRRNNGQ